MKSKKIKIILSSVLLLGLFILCVACSFKSKSLVGLCVLTCEVCERLEFSCETVVSKDENNINIPKVELP
jgi:hypothetical protein